ncbi:helicase SRCAP-like [Lytechinus pictus]|uniref:helicase SRCAP-like n=1 Tax=Lytechinus pictus TaxID=7653 RepID=UPI0030B9FA24
MQRGGRLGHCIPSSEVQPGQEPCLDSSTQLQKIVNETVLHQERSAGPQRQIDPVRYSNLSPRAVNQTGEVLFGGSPSVHAVEVHGQHLQVVAPELISVADYLAHSAATRSIGASQRQLVQPDRGSLAFSGETIYHTPSGPPSVDSVVQSAFPGSGLWSGCSPGLHGASPTTSSLPFSPSRTNPFHSSLTKPVKLNMSASITNQPPSEVVDLRRKTLEEKRKTLKEVQNSYVDKLTELYFLQQSHNMMDYVIWKKKQPDPHLASYLKNRQLEERPFQDLNTEVKTGTASSSKASLITLATTSAQEAAPQLKKRSDGDDSSRKGQLGSSGGLSAALASESRKRSSSQAGLDEAGEGHSVKLKVGGSEVSTKSESSSIASSRALPSITVIPATPTPGNMSGIEEAPLATKITADTVDVKGSVGLASPMRRNVSAPSSLGQMTSKSLVKSHLPTGLSRERQGTRQGALSAVYDYTIGSQEMIVERAKQEAQVMQRIAELRRDGLWSAKRLPRVQEPPRHKSHWDYLLEEMQWLATDFAQERRWKKNAARKLARAVAKHHQEQEAKEMKAGKEEVQKLKRIAGNIAKEIKAFWANIEKVVQYKQQSRLDERRKKALDLQLDFIVGQTEKYSSWLTEGLNTSTAGSSAQGSSVSSPRSDRMADDVEFEPRGDDSDDDEETIDVEEKQAAKAGEVSGVSEIEQLQRESELPIEELLSSLQEAQKEEEKKSSGKKAEEDPSKKREGTQSTASLKEVTAPESKITESTDDKDFELSADEDDEFDDDEKTLDEQEEKEGDIDHKAELNDLAADGEIPIEELLKQYQGAYAEDFDFSDADEDEESEEDEESSQESSSEDEEVDEEDAEQDQDELKDVGMEYLINPEKENVDLEAKPSQGTSEEAGPNREITDIAAAAQSLQPTGYTLLDTEVKTKVPFLLRHTLREYQHIGLDWLVTMLEKKLNGILADEMGLGKTIQTIALLSHLACEEACWGPHLIVVPTSVMLNWEMEFKKWCPGFKILTYFGSQKERKLKRTGWTKSNAFHICITSYKLVIQDHQSFRRKKWKYLVLDEAQNIKNFKSQRWQTLLNFSSQRRLLLTGTPLQNNLMELWSLMHFLMPHVFQSHREFKEWFSNPLGGMIEGTQEYNEGIIRRLHKVLRPFLLRRLKSQVEKQLPQKYEHVIRCRLSKRQRYLYDDFMAQTKTKETLSTGHFMSVINVLMQLRKVCNHPDLFEERPIVSPFTMIGILYYTASLVHRAMEYNPLKQVSLQALNLCIADLEISMPAYAAHRTCQLQTPRKLIEEIDSAPEPPSRPPKVKVKPGKLYPSPMALQAQKEARASPSLVNRPSDRASPSALHIHGRGSPSMVRVASPSSKGTPGSSGVTQVLVRSSSGVTLQPRASTPSQGTPQILQGRPGTPPVSLTAISNPRSPGTLTLVSQSPQPVPSGTPLQQLPGYTGTVSGNVSSLGQRRVLLQQQQVSGAGTNGRASLITTQPITVQLQSGSTNSAQQTGQRLLAGQIRQLPQGGIVQIIQTSGGQQIIRPAVQLTSQANLVNAQRSSNSPTLAAQRQGTPQMVLSHTAAQLQAAQQLHQSIQRQLTAQGVSPSQAQAVASQLSKVTAGQSPLQLQQRQIVLQQQQQPQQVVINAKGASVHTTPATQTVTCASSSSRPSSPSITIVQAARNVNASSPVSGVIKTSSPTTKTVTVPLASEKATNAAKMVGASSPAVKTTMAGVSPRVSTGKEESKESKEAAEKLKKAERKRKSSPLYLESLDKARADERKACLSRIASFNQQRCNAKPVYGQDLFTAVSLYHTSKPAGKRRPFSNGVGNIHCYHSLVGDALRRVEVAYKKTRNLRNILHSPEDYLEELQQIIKRYTFVVPRVSAPLITMHTSHTPPSLLNKERSLIDTLTAEVKPRSWCLHPIENLMRLDMPELRLIQYDCGKLQTLDVLLRKLKAETSRVLIFTQMTKMLDVLERFLNFHGHIYLRLDGTTKVEQRQIMMERFNKDPRIFCFILSTRSGGMGVNLTGANAVVFYDSDWNPTMDAQAQDRCHRIGQTRDVHIYRLISEMSIEENILKKSNQKRLLIDVSIEGGNFTTAFFKKHTIKDIFDVSKSAGSLEDLVEVEKPVHVEQPKESQQPEQDAKAADPLSQSELEKALARAEDDTDVKAASRAHAEQDAELAEFDESIPYEGEEGKGKEESSKLEMELAQLNEQLTPIERYAVVYLEETLEPITAEELKEAEEQVEAAKREWELGRLQALKEQEEREAELEEDEVLYTYSREDSENKVHKNSKNVKRKEKSRGTVEKSVRDTRQSRSDSREKSRRISGSREGSRASSRASSRAGSPPSIERQSRRVRSRASSGASGTDGDLSRRTRSRTSSESGSDRLPSPRGGDRAMRMAERDKRRDTSHKDPPRKIGRPRIRSSERSPERVLPKRKSSSSESGTESKGKSRSSDRGSVFSNGDSRKTRSGRSHRNVSLPEGSTVSGTLEPVVETRMAIDDEDESCEQINHLVRQSQDNLHAEYMKNAPEKRTRNIFDIVDTTMRIKDKIRDAIRPASESRTVGNVLEKINTKNLFADLAKKFKKKSVPEKSLPTHEEDASERSNSETSSVNHHPVNDTSNEIEPSTEDGQKRDQGSLTERDGEVLMLVDSHKEKELLENECKSVETTDDIDVDKVQSPPPPPSVDIQEDRDIRQCGNNISDVVEHERSQINTNIFPKSIDLRDIVSESVEMTDKSVESKSEVIVDQHSGITPKSDELPDVVGSESVEIADVVESNCEIILDQEMTDIENITSGAAAEVKPLCPTPLAVDQPSSPPCAVVEQPSSPPCAVVEQPSSPPCAVVEQPSSPPCEVVEQPSSPTPVLVVQTSSPAAVQVDKPLDTTSAGVDKPLIPTSVGESKPSAAIDQRLILNSAVEDRQLIPTAAAVDQSLSTSPVTVDKPLSPISAAVSEPSSPTPAAIDQPLSPTSAQVEQCSSPTPATIDKIFSSTSAVIDKPSSSTVSTVDQSSSSALATVVVDTSHADKDKPLNLSAVEGDRSSTRTSAMEDQPSSPLKAVDIPSSPLVLDKLSSPSQAFIFQSKEACGVMDEEINAFQDTDRKKVVDDAPVITEVNVLVKELTLLVEENIEENTMVDQTLYIENENPDVEFAPSKNDKDLTTQHMDEVEVYTGNEKLDEAMTTEAPCESYNDIEQVTSLADDTLQASELLKEVEPPKEEAPMPLISPESHVCAEKTELTQPLEELPEVVVSNPDPIDDSSLTLITAIDTSVSHEQDIDDSSGDHLEINIAKAEKHDDQDSKDVMEVDTEQVQKEMDIVENKHKDGSNENLAEKNSKLQGDVDKEQSYIGQEQDLKDNEGAIISGANVPSTESIDEKVPHLDLSEINKDEDAGPQDNATDSVISDKDDSSSKVDNDDGSDAESIELPSPPKPTRRVREILNLALPGEKPVNLDIDRPSARTRSQNTGDTVRTRSRVKPSSSPNIGSVLTPLRASPRSSGGKASTKKSLESSGVGAKRSPRLGNSDPGVHSHKKRTLRSTNVS